MFTYLREHHYCSASECVGNLGLSWRERALLALSSPLFLPSTSQPVSSLPPGGLSCLHDFLNEEKKLYSYFSAASSELKEGRKEGTKTTKGHKRWPCLRAASLACSRLLLLVSFRVLIPVKCFKLSKLVYNVFPNHH